MKSKKISKLLLILTLSISTLSLSNIRVQAIDNESSELYEKLIINGREVINYTTTDKEKANKDSLERRDSINRINNKNNYAAASDRTRYYSESSQASNNSNVKLESSMFLNAELKSISTLAVTGGTTTGTLDGTNPVYADSITISQTTTTGGIGVSTIWPPSVSVNGKTGTWSATKRNAYKLEAPRESIKVSGLSTPGMNITINDGTDMLIGSYVYKARTYLNKTFDNVYYNTDY